MYLLTYVSHMLLLPNETPTSNKYFAAYFSMASSYFDNRQQSLHSMNVLPTTPHVHSTSQW